MEWYWYIVLCVIVLAVCYILFNFLKVKRMKEGTGSHTSPATGTLTSRRSPQQPSPVSGS